MEKQEDLRFLLLKLWKTSSALRISHKGHQSQTWRQSITITVEHVPSSIVKFGAHLTIVSNNHPGPYLHPVPTKKIKYQFDGHGAFGIPITRQYDAYFVGSLLIERKTRISADRSVGWYFPNTECMKDLEPPSLVHVH